MSITRLLPKYAKAASCLVVLLHGVGADAGSMMELGREIQHQNPTAAIVIPDAPNPSDISSNGRQWFSVRGVSEINRHDRIQAALGPLQDLIERERHRLCLDRSHLAVCGFSQGAMMALALANAPNPPHVIGSIGGRIAGPVTQVMDRPAHIFLTHGDRDMVVPFLCLAEAQRSFESAGHQVTSRPMAGLGHQIARSQMAAFAGFIGANLVSHLLAVAS